MIRELASSTNQTGARPGPDARCGISVVIPTRDRRAVLRRTLCALDAQVLAPGEELEVVVVDTGSTDGTIEEVQSWSRSASIPVHVLAIDAPNVSIARNLGVEASRHEFVLFLNDDTVPVGKAVVGGHLASLRRQPRGRAVLGRVRYPDELLVDPLHAWLNDWGQFDYRSLGQGAAPQAHHFITAHIAFSRADFVAAGGMDERLAFGCEDLALGVRMLRTGVEIVYIPEAVTEHIHEVTLEGWLARTTKMGEAGQLFNELYPDTRECPHTVSPYWVAQQVAATALAPRLGVIDRLPRRWRMRGFQLMHQGFYTQGYRAARAARG